MNYQDLLTTQDTQKQFVAQSGLDFAEPTYISCVSKKLSEIGLQLTNNQFDGLAVDIINLIDKKVESIKKWQNQELLDECYPADTIDLITQNKLQFGGDFCYARLSFIVDTNGKPNLIEINAQTPSFNYELESGTDLMLDLLQKPARNSQYITNLTNCLMDNLVALSQKINKPLGECRIGMMTCDSAEDLFEMKYLHSIVQSQKKCQQVSVFSNLECDFDSDNRIFNSKTNDRYDIIFNWYPLELAVGERYPDGTSFGELLAKSQTPIFNFDSFLAQNKYLLVDLKHPNIVPSFYTQEELREYLSTNIPTVQNNFVAKPIFGRQSLGIFGNNNSIHDNLHNNTQNHKMSGDLGDDYYNNQPYLYQPFVDSYPLIINKNLHNFVLEKFVYKTKTGWTPGGHGLRVNSPDTFTNDISPWVVIE